MPKSSIAVRTPSALIACSRTAVLATLRISTDSVMIGSELNSRNR